MNVGILALQGGFEAHAKSVKACGEAPVYIKKAADMKNIDALILPGGESTTHHHLLEKYGIRQAILDFHKAEKPIFGTCAGSILISDLKLLDITVKRNAYGSQKFSFETELHVDELDIPSMRGVFIRAPKFTNVPTDVKILCSHDDSPVLVVKGKVMAATFHPELTEDTRLHKYFLNLV
jgi:5'-phosphate synthase pdxT subunit